MPIIIALHKIPVTVGLQIKWNEAHLIFSIFNPVASSVICAIFVI